MPRYVMENSSYQWLQNGDCSKCTREKFCKKKCEAYKKKTGTTINNGKRVVLKNKK